MKNKSDLTNLKINKLLVLEKVSERKPGYSVYHWLCRCDCGNLTEVPRNQLLHKKHPTQSCGCNRGIRGIRNVDSSFNKLFSIYTFSAKKRNLEFNLNKEQFRLLTSATCHYCGNPPQKVIKNSKNNYSDYIYNGIDRKDNSSGYTINNCVSCCETCNFLKSTYSYKEFTDIILKIADFLRSKDEKKI